MGVWLQAFTCHHIIITRHKMLSIQASHSLATAGASHQGRERQPKAIAIAHFA